jgi:DNA-binding LytR/AlgR family response regulator
VIRVVLVEDEAPARERLKLLLAAHADVRVVGECEDGDTALARLASDPPDLVFLDIEMPGADGLEVAERLPAPRPAIVFCTAYDRFALEAFERDAKDYLLKPVNADRLARALDKVRAARGSSPRLQREAESARALQERWTAAAALPSWLDVHVLARPAREVSGDFAVVAERGDRVLLAVGDVGGKGVDAGFLAAGLRERLRMGPSEPGTACAEAAAWFESHAESSRIASLLVVEIGPGALRWANAGHPPGLATGGIRLERTGPVLGSPGAPRWETREVPGPRAVLLFSDGISEAEDARGVTFLPSLAPGEDAESLARSLYDEARRHRGGAAFDDDVTVLAARVR